MLIIGAGGHAKVAIELLLDANCNLTGILDADPSPRTVLGVPVLGNDELLPTLRSQGRTHAFVAVGDNALRLRLAQRVEAAGFVLVNAISRQAIISPSAKIGRGVAIMPGAIINAGAVVEDLVIVNTGAIVDHDCTLEEACHIGPGAALAGGVRIGHQAFVGIGARAIPGITVGPRSQIGAGAAVCADIPSDVLALGVPARVLRPVRSAT